VLVRFAIEQNALDVERLRREEGIIIAAEDLQKLAGRHVVDDESVAHALLLGRFIADFVKGCFAESIVSARISPTLRGGVRADDRDHDVQQDPQ